jgi:uncharacterized membrane protein
MPCRVNRMTAKKAIMGGGLWPLVGLGLLLGAVETLALPRSFPFKLGLANLLAVLLICSEGIKPAMLYTLLRIIFSSLIFGTFLVPPMFYLALSGGIAAVLVMGLAKKLLGNWVSALGVSILGGVTHLLVQVEVLSLFFGAGVTFLRPYMFIWGALAGSIIGLLALLIEVRLQPYRIALERGSP